MIQTVGLQNAVAVNDPSQQVALIVDLVVNVADRVIDVFSGPSGPTALTPDYATTTTYRPGDTVPVVLAGITIGTVNAADLLP